MAMPSIFPPQGARATSADRRPRQHLQSQIWKYCPVSSPRGCDSHRLRNRIINLVYAHAATARFARRLRSRIAAVCAAIASSFVRLIRQAKRSTASFSATALRTAVVSRPGATSACARRRVAGEIRWAPVARRPRLGRSRDRQEPRLGARTDRLVRFGCQPTTSDDQNHAGRPEHPPSRPASAADLFAGFSATKSLERAD